MVGRISVHVTSPVMERVRSRESASPLTRTGSSHLKLLITRAVICASRVAEMPMSRSSRKARFRARLSLYAKWGTATNEYPRHVQRPRMHERITRISVAKSIPNLREYLCSSCGDHDLKFASDKSTEAFDPVWLPEWCLPKYARPK